MLSEMERMELIAKIRSLPDQLESLVAGLSPEQLGGAYLAGEWTVAQNVHHLFDSHANSYIRCRLILTEDSPPLKPYKQDAWAALPDASDPDISVSLRLLRALHARWARFWESLPEDAWARSGVHPEYGTMSLADMLRSYTDHGEAHLDQITRTLAAA
ncbi:DinB family protein [Oscillochloris sp. ZM17-4]|uniref:DinB family protein n=1 Tax=Oscillochloris sp. ZM17-4 TaxID=2866714 RepID=UPI001C73AF2E|nr:DinB family protein [Oscillochloris sp. ZM17-4]MBX0327969.1 DinB family protein [Oscillochloris sp. ZM17-4]